MTTTEIIIAIVGVLGSLASFYGAYLSIQAKIEAKTSADQAEAAKNQVIKKQKTTHLAELLYQAKRVQQSFGKYSITQNKGLTCYSTFVMSNLYRRICNPAHNIHI